MPQFSVIMPSRLADYAGAAQNREQKLLRAIGSVIMQTFKDWELNIVADSCEKTIELVQKFVKDERVNLWSIEHTKLWSGRPRNTGIVNATGEWIVYLDIDDVYGENHLKIISEGLGKYDWVYFDDFRYIPKLENWFKNPCDINRLGKHGTSNVCHKRSLNVLWEEQGKYSHDHIFVQKLLRFKNSAKINTPEYYVCHVPGTKNSGAYDI
jgi:glycosyltransferase involved in cell wall biosynthesis